MIHFASKQFRYQRHHDQRDQNVVHPAYLTLAFLKLSQSLIDLLTLRVSIVLLHLRSKAPQDDDQVDYEPKLRQTDQHRQGVCYHDRRLDIVAVDVADLDARLHDPRHEKAEEEQVVEQDEEVLVSLLLDQEKHDMLQCPTQKHGVDYELDRAQPNIVTPEKRVPVHRDLPCHSTCIISRLFT